MEARSSCDSLPGNSDYRAAGKQSAGRSLDGRVISMWTVQLGQDNTLSCIACVAGEMDDVEACRQGRHGRHNGSTNR